MEILAQSALFLTLISFTFGVTALSQNFLSRVFQTFAVACMAISLWAFFFFLSFLWDSSKIYDLHLAMNAWLTAPVLLFLQYWTRTEKWKGNQFLFYLSLGLSALLSILLMPGLDRESLTKRIIYFTPSLIVFQVLWFMIHDEKMRNLSELPRRSLLYSGVLLILATCLMDHIPGLWVGISVFGNLALMGFLFFIRHNLLKRQKFLHTDVFLGQFLVLILVSAFLTAIYSVVVVWVKGDFPLFLLNAFILSFFLVNVIPSFTRLITYALDYFLDDRVKALRLAVAETYSDVLRMVDFQEVNARVTDFLHEEFKVVKHTILLQEPSRQFWTTLDYRYQYSSSHPVIHEAFHSGGKKIPSAFSVGEQIEERRRARAP